MRFTVSSVPALVVAAVLALVDPQIECGCFPSLSGKLSKEWQWIDNFVRDKSPRELINNYFKDNFMEPKMRDALNLVAAAVSARPSATGCRESESLKVARLFEALGMGMSAVYERGLDGVRKLAFETRKEYGGFCAKNYADRLSAQLDNKLNGLARMGVENFGMAYAKTREIEPRDLFNPTVDKKFNGLGFVTSGLVGRALYAGLANQLPSHKRKFNEKTGREELQWVELVAEMRGNCNVYQNLVADVLGDASRDYVVARSLDRLDSGDQIWVSWVSTIACNQLKNFDDKKLAGKLAAAAGKS